jgi:hypothetical protein
LLNTPINGATEEIVASSWIDGWPGCHGEKLQYAAALARLRLASSCAADQHNQSVGIGFPTWSPQRA